MKTFAKSLPEGRTGWMYRSIALVWCILMLLAGIRYFNISPVWNPNDELPHLDYIDRLAFESRIPSDGEFISDRTFRFHLDLKVQNPHDFDGTKKKIYPIGYSYESHQPPLYYSLMAIPWRLLADSGLTAELKLDIMRLISFGFQLAALLLIFPFFKELQKMYPGSLSPEFPFFCFAFLLFTGLQNRFGINNDQAATLPVLLSSIYYLRFRNTGTSRYLTASSLLASVAFWIKFTTGLYALVLFIALVFQFSGDLRKFRFRSFLNISFPFVLIPTLLLLNLYIFGYKNWLNNEHNKLILSFFQPGMLEFRNVILLQWKELFGLEFLWNFHPVGITIGYVFLAFSISGTILAAYHKMLPPWLLPAAIVSLLLYICIFLLNRYVCCVAWFSIRLYQPYLLYVLLAFGGFLAINRLFPRYLTHLILLISYYPILRYLWIWY